MPHIGAIQVCVSQDIADMLGKKPSLAREHIVEHVDKDITYFLHKGAFESGDVARLCCNISSRYGPCVVSTNFVNGESLYIFVDIVSPDAQSKFVYDQQDKLH